MARPSLPDTAAISDSGHVTDHNLIVAGIQNLYDYSVEITHPSTDDVKVRVHDGTAWQTVWYDSGWRNISSLVTAGYLGSTDSTALLRRVGTAVHLVLSLDGTTIGTGTKTFFTMPTGFSPSYVYLHAGYYVEATGGANSWYITGGALTASIGSPAMPDNTRVMFSWQTNAATPTSLPGTNSFSAPA